MSSSPIFSSATELARRIREREISCRELLDLYLARIDKLNGPLNAVVTLDVERARARADAADVALSRGQSWGPLHGLPATIKDTFEVEGIRTTAGAPQLSDHISPRTAVAAQRLIDAGAVIFGKTNTPLMAGDVQSYNEVFGTTKNPWSHERTPGGSSGGAAAALAAGLTAFEYGSDIGGSIRTPSNWCGTYGHKPTWGIVPSRGHIPGPPGALSEADLGVVGPMTRSAEDLRLLLDITAGPLPDRARAWSLKLPPPRHARLQEYRVAAWFDDASAPVDPAVAAVLDATAAALRKAGVDVVEAKPAGLVLPELVRTYQQLLFPIIMADFPPHVFEEMANLSTNLPADDDTPLARIARFGTQRHRQWLSAHEAREHERARAAKFFESYDVLLCPVTPVAAIAHDHSDPMAMRTIQVGSQSRSYFDLFHWIALATMAYLPASVAPVGRTASGLQVGVQISGPYFEDTTTIDFAGRLGEVVGGFEPPPDYA